MLIEILCMYVCMYVRMYVTEVSMDGIYVWYVQYSCICMNVQYVCVYVCTYRKVRFIQQGQT